MLQKYKNLGPCAMNLEECIKQFIDQHLSDANFYERITQGVVKEHIANSMEEFFNTLKNLEIASNLMNTSV